MLALRLCVRCSAQPLARGGQYLLGGKGDGAWLSCPIRRLNALYRGMSLPLPRGGNSRVRSRAGRVEVARRRRCLLEPHACTCQRWAHRAEARQQDPPLGRDGEEVAPANQHVSHCPMERPFCSGCSFGNESLRSPVSASPAPGLCGKDTTRAWPGLPPELWDAASGVSPTR